MKGGMRRRVMSSPLSIPQAVPKAKPRSRAATPGTPNSLEALAMMMETKTAMAPTERSTPAVRMMSVWPMASVPTTATWPMTSETLPALRNRSGAFRLKATSMMTSTMSGPRAG